VLVIEEGGDFLVTSFFAHQAKWTRSYGEPAIFKLHHATTGDAPGARNRPIICGRAVTQGGGGSINYTMMHESSGWLAGELGAGGAFPAAYWDALKDELGALFQRGDPELARTPVANAVHAALTGGAERFDSVASAAPWVPHYIDGPPPSGGGGAAGAVGRVYSLTNQFNDFGERTNSGVSLVAGGRDWRSEPRIDLWTSARVEALEFDSAAGGNGNGDGGGGGGGGGGGARCSGLRVRPLGGLTMGERDVKRVLFDPDRTTVVLAAGAGTPRLLLPHRDTLRNAAIGTRVNDHVLMPLGFYVLKQAADGSPAISPKDEYLPMFACREVAPTAVAAAASAGAANGDVAAGNGAPGGPAVVVSYDFFAGPLSELSYFAAHLLTSLWLPNWAKRRAIAHPWVFGTLREAIALVLQAVEFITKFNLGLIRRGKPLPPLILVTAILKVRWRSPDQAC
jgi:hypothetical protein